MTTVNGKFVPDHYRSIESLPEIIDALDRDVMAWSDGNYTEDEMSWLHEFHIYCGDRHYINEADMENAGIHGPRAYRQLTAEQKWDLAAYFSSVFPNYTTKKTTPHSSRASGHRPGNQNPPATTDVTRAVIENEESVEESIEELGHDFTETMLPESRQSLYRDAMRPLISQLPPQEQLILLRELNSLDPSVPYPERVDNIMAVMRQHDVDDSSLAFLLGGEYSVSVKTTPDIY